MSGVFGQRFPRKYSLHFRLRQLGEILRQLLLRVTPGEVGVALREARLRQRLHHFRLGEGFGEKDRIGKFRADAPRSNIPKTATGLVCGLSTRKMRTPCSPKRE